VRNVEFRRAGPEDLSAILKLQSENYIAHLSPQERAEGFLSAEFTPAQLADMAADLGIIVAADSRSLLGYLCAFRTDMRSDSPVIAKMLESFAAAQYDGRPLSSYTTFIYGPVCIGRAHRRRGLLRGLYRVLRAEVEGKFEVGVAFVARDNPHSLQAHVAGLGMREVGEFEAGGNTYVLVAFKVSLTDSNNRGEKIGA
jgi:hypothetical protein